MDHQKYIDILAQYCKEVFEGMAATTVRSVTVKPDERGPPEYAHAHVISYEHLEGDVSGDFILGFPSVDMSLTVASAISEGLGLGEVTEFGDDARETLSEFMNTVVGRALAGWDSIGLPAKFGAPRWLDFEQIQVYRAAHTAAYMIILTLDMEHIRFHVTFTKGMADPLLGKSVLVTDDSRIIRKLLRKALEEVGLEVHEAGDGKQAIEMFTSASPDLVIMDIVMPEMGGLEAAKRIRDLDGNAKVIMLTSTARRDEINTAHDVGALSYLLKPVKVPQLMQALREALG